jgi:peptidyl-prolyl cis-trans isomerase C
MTFPRPGLAAAVLLALGLPVASALAQTPPATAPAPAAAATKGATVNGVAIPASRIDAIAKQQAARGVPDSPQLRNEVREQLIVREIIAQEATRKGLAKSPDVQAQLDLARQQVLWNAYIADFIKANPIPDATLKAEYEKLKASRGDREYKTRHILVEKEDEAKAIIAELKKGRKFEELAKQS